jgi:large subunit ribosomal protein L4
MTELAFYDNDGKAKDEKFTAADSLFARAWNEALMHQVATAILANARSGTRAQKNRAMVRHSTKKPWRQKGTGRSRSGSTSSPIWRGGGRAHPSMADENFRHKINRKMFRAALAMALSKLAAEERLIVAEELTMSAPKTKALAARLALMNASRGRALFVDVAAEANFALSARNLPAAELASLSRINPADLLRRDKVIFAARALRRAEELWA